MSNVNWPNFLIVGAAKAGTTALYHQLTQHSEVFMSEQKEMNFFALKDQTLDFKGPGDMDGIHRTSITNQSIYISFFSNLKNKKAIGEVSPLYLYSPIAPELINSLIPNSKIIIILRNPVDRAFSAFSHLRRDHREKIDNFEKAFDQNDTRKELNWAEIWHYKSMGLYFDQVQRYLQYFPKNQMLFIIYDDFVNTPQKVLEKLCTFLSINSNFKFDTESKYNKSGTPRFQSFHQMLIRPHLFKKILKNFLPKFIRTHIRESLLNLNLKKNKSLTSAQFDSIYPAFKDDIEKLERLLNLDLSQWKSFE
jgi:hypothetical protein